MKTNILPITAFLAALAAVALLPVSAATASLALTVTGVLLILVADYGRSPSTLEIHAPVMPFHPAGLATASLRQAA